MRPRVLALIAVLLLPLMFLAPSAVADEPSVVIRGEVRVGLPVDAVVAGVTGDVSYVWTLDGVPAVQKTLPNGYPRPAHRFFLYEGFDGKSLSVTAVVTSGEGEPLTLVSASQVIAPPGAMLSNRPTVSGKLMEGEVLTVAHNVIYPTDGVTFGYQWHLDPHATGSTLLLGPQHVGARPNVVVTASKPGWRTSLGSNFWSGPDLGVILPKQIRPGGVRLAEYPTIISGAEAIVEGWDDFETFEDSYQWMLDGRPLAGQTGAALRISPTWIGRAVSVQLTRSRADGSSTVTTTSPPQFVGGVQFGVNNLGTFSGRQAVAGWPLSFTPKPLGKGETRSYQWVRLDYNHHETVIPQATSSRYRITAADIGYKIGVWVTTSGPGYETARMRYVTPNATVLNVYTTPGSHTVNGRQWRTVCEPYSQTVRCRAEIWATQVLKVKGRYTRVTGWAFNNLSYLPLTGGGWGNNPLANTKEWTDAQGRRWKTECERGTCRTYIHMFVASAQPSGNGGWRYGGGTQWVFNNIVYVS